MEVRIGTISVHVGFMVDNVALGQVFLSVLLFSSVSVIPPMLHTHSFIYCRRCVTLAIDSVVNGHTEQKNVAKLYL
jgi:hypothetical protein